MWLLTGGMAFSFVSLDGVLSVLTCKVCITLNKYRWVLHNGRLCGREVRSEHYECYVSLAHGLLHVNMHIYWQLLKQVSKGFLVCEHCDLCLSSKAPHCSYLWADGKLWVQVHPLKLLSHRKDPVVCGVNFFH